MNFGYRGYTMTRTKTVMTALLVLVLCNLSVPRPAHAYLDPGTGALIVQVVIAGVIGAAATLAVYWKRVRSFVANGFKKKS